MPTGHVRHLREDRGFFFIGPDDGSANIFGHANSIAQDSVYKFTDLNIGDRVSFDIQASTRKPGTAEAVNIRVLH